MTRAPFSLVMLSGLTASQSGENYVANWWAQGQSPATNSGGAGSGQPWTATGACSSCSGVPNVPTGLVVKGGVKPGQCGGVKVGQ
jgi:chitinase